MKKAIILLTALLGLNFPIVSSSDCEKNVRSEAVYTGDEIPFNWRIKVSPLEDGRFVVRTDVYPSDSSYVRTKIDTVKYYPRGGCFEFDYWYGDSTGSELDSLKIKYYTREGPYTFSLERNSDGELE